MGQKIHPTGFRIGIREPWRSRWYAKKPNFKRLLIEDQKIRKYVKKEFYFAGISRVEIERLGDELYIILNTARPGVIIGRKGAKVEELRTQLSEMCGCPVELKIREISRPELDATLVAQGIAEQLSKRASFGRVIKRAIEATMSAGAKGVKIRIKGRLGGAEMARKISDSRGKVPLQTIDARIDYALAEAKTNAGIIGVKVWINLGKYDQEDIRNAPYAEKSKISKKPARKDKRQRLPVQ